MKTQVLNNLKLFLIVLLLVLAVCIFLLLGRIYISGSAIGGDGVYYYSNLKSIIIDQDLNLQNEYEYFHHQTSGFTGNSKIPVIPEKNPITQKLPAKYPIGSAIILAPTFLLTHLTVTVLQNLGVGIVADGYNLIYQTSAALTSLIYAFLGIILIYYLGIKLFEKRIAFIGTLIIWLGTPLIYYTTMEPLSSHPISFFSVSFFIYLWFINREKNKNYIWILMGIIGGLMSIVRYQDSLFLLIPIIDQILIFRKKYITGFLLLIFFAGTIIAAQLFVNNYLNGSLFLTGYGDAGFPYLTSPKIFYTLLSFERGLFVWSPASMFAVVGLYWFIKRFKLVGSLLSLLVLLQVYTVSSWADPSQGDSFGNRILLNSNIIFALGLMQFLKENISYQTILLSLFTILILVNGVLAGLFIFRVIGQPY